MRQFLKIFLFDIKMNFKSFMGVYMLIVPLAILLVLRAFLPSVANTKTTIAMVTAGPHALPSAVIEEVSEWAHVKEYDSVEAMEQKLRGTGHAEGLYWDPVKEQYVSVLERNIKSNKVFSTGSRFIRQWYYKENYPNGKQITRFRTEAPEDLAARTEKSPVATMGGAIFMAFMVIICAFMIGLGVVNDKEEGTNRAIQVSPATKADYFAGRSLWSLILTLAYTIIAILILGLWGVNLLQV